jgi:RND family efflux transporter MFP subunit
MFRFPTARLFAGTLLVLALAACGDSGPQKGAEQGPPPLPVTVANPVKRTVVDMDEYVGRFVAVDAVEIRARVSGYLDKVHFEDGQIVKEGDLLFTIDQRPFQAALDQARADLERAKAGVDLAGSELVRAQSLIGRQAIAESVYEQRLQAKRSADAQLQAAEANVRNAELNLEFTELRAPVRGRIGDRRVSPGNVVSGGAIPTTTLLATIVSIDPIRFEFTFDEAAYLRYARLRGDGTQAFTRGNPTPVELKLLDEEEFDHKGTIDFVDNVIDQSSGTIRGRAEFKNPNGLFTPGMFARVRLPASAPFETLLIPDSAIGTEQVRKFVYAVDGENTVQQKYVSLGPLLGKLRVIRSGLEAGDRVIVNGFMRARPGGKVTPHAEGEMPQMPGMAGGAGAKGAKGGPPPAAK